MSLSAKLKLAYGAMIERTAAFNLPSLGALLILPAFKTLKRGKTPDAPTVLILAKEGFTSDIMSTLGAADGVKIVALPRIVIKFFAQAFLPYFVDDSNYASCGAEFDAAKLRYRNFWIAVLRRLRRLVRIDAVVTGNFAYAAERELAAALQEIGIPFIVLHKENLRAAGLIPFKERLYRERRGPFTGRKILVYNQPERDLQIRAGVAEPSRVEVVGMPRLDRMHAWRRSHAGALAPNRILFLIFSAATGMPRIWRKGAVPGQRYSEEQEEEDEDISLQRLSEETCLTLLRIAKENPDIEVVVKSKGRNQDYAEMASLFGVEQESQLPGNMRVVHGGDISELIAQASVVCGCNSVALLEAVAAGKPIVVPGFAEAEAPEIQPYLMDLRSVSMPASSPEILYRELLKLAREPRPVPAELDAESRRTLALWTGNDDGCAAQRARDAILRELASR
jgi:hypothetical protein